MRERVSQDVTKAIGSWGQGGDVGRKGLVSESHIGLLRIWADFFFNANEEPLHYFVQRCPVM